MKKSFVVGALLLAASTAFAQSESEPNDSRGSSNIMNAIPTSITGGLPGSFGNTGNAFFEDFWEFSANSGTQYTFAASGGNGVFPMDIGLELQNAGGSVLVNRDLLGDNQGENFSWNAPSAGTYYLVVYEATNTANGGASYTVNVSAVAAVDDWSIY
jgi:hypothetical protein